MITNPMHLVQSIEWALRFFSLPASEMDKIDVRIDGTSINFFHGGRAMAFEIKRVEK